ncbi:hypothetical protein N7527_009190 [Penicillium freii]|nr:hypothetical protein N7527_009190 [Penicillium freii]
MSQSKTAEPLPHVTHEFNNCKFDGSTSMIVGGTGRVVIRNPDNGLVILASGDRDKAWFLKNMCDYRE